MKHILIVLLIVFTDILSAQIKIGDNPQTLDTNSLLELESNSKALVISRVSEAEMLAITPLQGAMVYNIDSSCIFYYDGTTWNNLCNGSSVGNITWGNITGDISTQTDLTTVLENYVDISTNQNGISGEKTFTSKLTVDTGIPTDQAAEFLGRVKGKAGTAQEDFVTLAQLDASGDGGGTWGAITGTLTNQLDLATEFQNYVDLTNTQTISGEKTLTSKLTVDTGTLTDQAAEFLGRVKGEPGTAQEDFVTKAQLDDISGTISGTEGSIFFADSSGSPDENNTNLFWDNTNNQLRVGDNPPVAGTTNSTLSVQGSVSKPIHNDVNVLIEDHYTTTINYDTWVTLPEPSTCYGRIYIIKTGPYVTVNIASFRDYKFDWVNVFEPGVTHLQSNGVWWEQIN